MNQFDFDAVGITSEPDVPRLSEDAYEVIRRHVNEMLAETQQEDGYGYYITNQFHLHSALDYAFHDLGGLIEASILVGKWEDTPSLARALKRAKVAGLPMPQFESHFAHLTAQAMDNAQRELAAASIRNLRQSPSYMLASQRDQAVMERQATPHIAAIQNGNLSQMARGIQTTTWFRVKDHFINAVRRFHEWTERNGWKYSLRMPIAMIPAMRDQLLQSSRLGGIAMPEAYQSATQNELVTLLFDAGVIDMIFRPMIEAEQPAIQNRANFIWWDSIASQATAIHESGMHVSLKPATLPPWLMFSHDRAASFFTGEYTLGTYSELGVGHIVLSPDDLCPDFGYLHEDDNYYVARNLSLIAMGVSLWATQIRLGTGHRVPSWTRTPLNPVTVQWFVEELARMNQ